MKRLIFAILLALAIAALCHEFPAGLTEIGNQRPFRSVGAAVISPDTRTTNATVKVVYQVGSQAVTNTVLTLSTTTGYADTNVVNRLVMPGAKILVEGHPVHLATE